MDCYRQLPGAFKDGLPNGHGTMKSASGATYAGAWKDGVRHGHGHGHGTGTWFADSTYTGQWNDGVRHGHGTETLPDGTKRTGGWKYGELEL